MSSDIVRKRGQKIRDLQARLDAAEAARERLLGIIGEVCGTGSQTYIRAEKIAAAKEPPRRRYFGSRRVAEQEKEQGAK